MYQFKKNTYNPGATYLALIQLFIKFVCLWGPTSAVGALMVILELYIEPFSIPEFSKDFFPSEVLSDL